MFRQAVFVLLVCIIFEGSRSTDDSSSIQNTLKKLNDTLHKLPVEFDTVIDDVEEELKEVWGKYDNCIQIIVILNRNI